jgi:hypothetical protein
VQVWGNLASLYNKQSLGSLLAQFLAVKVFLNDAVGLIGKPTPVLWTVSGVLAKKTAFSIQRAISADPAAKNALVGKHRAASVT